MNETNGNGKAGSEPASGDKGAVALDALAWIMTDDKRAVRFLDLTGLTPQSLRESLHDPATHDAVLGFLGAHEPDLLAYAEARGIDPDRIARAIDRDPS